jgi:hypothetical protein
MKLSIIILILIIITIVNAWHESSKCTNTQTDSNSNSNEDYSSSSSLLLSTTKVLNLNCKNNNLLFIAWSHYGQHMNNNTTNNNNNNNCYFMPKDCTVSVDYVANECNGLNSCQISLDSQYLHSCKSYSDYLFIIYDCIQVKSTVNICDYTTNIDTTTTTNQELYLQTPNYPNEYLNNLDCNCSLRITSLNNKINSIEFELLEFDLESTTSSILNNNNNLNINNNNNNNINLLSSSSNILKSDNTCTKDYLSLNFNNNNNNNETTKICGTFSSFQHLQTTTTTNNVIDTNIHFSSDDTLTRRGFWIKMKTLSNLNIKCPNDFILIDNICIKIYNDLVLTWYEAHNYCLEKGYSLAIIDNFELDKQINKIIFSSNNQNNEYKDDIIKLKTTNNNNKFWTGMRHLNETNWFDYKNELIKFRNDESKWWPWLVIDSTTYNIGSCVAKKQNWLFLQDCYKKLPFACQSKQQQQQQQQNNNNNNRLQLKCGSSITETNPTTTTTLIKTNTIQFQLNTTKQQIEQKSIILIHPNSNEIENENLIESSKQSNINNNNNNNNSTLLICLISSITLLIAFINSIVIIVICKRRKLLLKKNNNINNNNNYNDDIINTSSAGTNSSSSLTFTNSKQYNNNHTICNRTGGLFIQPSTISTSTSKIINRSDPLGHIYETISVSSNDNNNYNLFNYNNNNNNIMLSATATNFRPIKTNNNRFNELNNSNTNSSTSPTSSSSTTSTTQTTINSMDILNQSSCFNPNINNNRNHFILINQQQQQQQLQQPSSFYNNKQHLLVCSTNDLLQLHHHQHQQLQHQQQQHHHQHQYHQTFNRNSFRNNHFIISNDNNKKKQINNGNLNFLTNPVEAIV